MLQTQRLKELRKRKKLIQQNMADLLNVTRTAYVKYEKGQSQPPNDSLLIMADFFGVSTDYLLGNSDDPTPPDRKKEASAGKTPTEAAIEYFKAENGRDPTEDELRTLMSVAEGLFRTLPDKRALDQKSEIYIAARDGEGFDRIEDGDQACNMSQLIDMGESDKNPIP
jgi:transcriptional regulator with XRE-family HTH domain